MIRIQPWGWPHECPKHVSDYCVIKLHSYIHVHLLVFLKNRTHLINAWNIQEWKRCLQQIGTFEIKMWLFIKNSETYTYCLLYQICQDPINDVKLYADNRHIQRFCHTGVVHNMWQHTNFKIKWFLLKEFPINARVMIKFCSVVKESVPFS